MQIPRILIAAAGSGSGKTTLTCLLLQLLRDRGKEAAAFKCGPDYIDPMFHREVQGIPSKNLDPYFTDASMTRALFQEAAKGRDLAVVEGVMGLYDGLGGIREEASSYHLACMLKTPILLVVNAHGMGRSLLALIAGFLQYDREHLIQGVFLNQISPMFYQTVKSEIEENLPVRVLGYLPKDPSLSIESRHLGLKLPGEAAHLRQRLQAGAARLEESLDLEGLFAMAKAAEPFVEEEKPRFPAGIARAEKKVRIGIAMDEAFCFYYEDNLRLLRKLGAELVPFSPIRDAALPEAISGLLLGGGYPELHAEALSQNIRMREAVRKAVEGGMPSIAECGGFLYLHRELETGDGKRYPMAGVLAARCYDTGRLTRFGYVELTEQKSGRKLRAHEFHYFDSEENGADCIARKPVGKRSWACVHAAGPHWWGFPHLYYYSNPDFAADWIERVRDYERNTRTGDSDRKLRNDPSGDQTEEHRTDRG